MSEFSIEDQIKLTKFYLSANLYQFTVFYSQNFDILFNFESQMAYASEDVKIAASQYLQSSDLVYEGVKVWQQPSTDYIAIYDGNRIRIVLLLKPQAMRPVVQACIKLVMKEFADKFESKFRKELKNYEQFQGSFTNIEDIFRDTFTLDLSLPHTAKYKGLASEDKLEDYIFRAADKFNKLAGYFYLENLIHLAKQFVVDEARTIVMTDPRKAKKEGIDPDHIDFPPVEAFYIAMFNLRKLAMLEAIKIDQLNSFSKIYYTPPAK